MKLHSLILIGCSISLFGCSPVKNYIDGRENLYLKSNDSTPLKVPAGLSSANVGQDYVIPSTAGQRPTRPPNLTPPNSLADEVEQGKVSKAALKQQEKQVEKSLNSSSNTLPVITPVASSVTGSTLHLNQPLSQAWTTIGNAASQAGYKILVQNQNTHTYYILDTKKKVMRETPIYQLHLKKKGTDTQVSITDNNDQPVSAEVAQPILNELSGKLATNIAATITAPTTPANAVNNASINTQATNTPTISTLNGSTLEIKQRYNQAWNILGSVLPQIGYKILVQNQKTGVYYILDTKKKVTRDTPIYQLHVRNTRTATQVNVTDNNGNSLSTEAAQPILAGLNNQLAGAGETNTTIADNSSNQTATSQSAKKVSGSEKSNFGNFLRSVGVN